MFKKIIEIDIMNIMTFFYQYEIHWLMVLRLLIKLSRIKKGVTES